MQYGYVCIILFHKSYIRTKLEDRIIWEKYSEKRLRAKPYLPLDKPTDEIIRERYAY